MSQDAASVALVALHSNAVTEDVEFQGLIEAIERLVRGARGVVPALTLVVEPGQSAPDARSRRRLAELKSRVGPCRAAVARAWLEVECNRKLPVLPRLYAEARALSVTQRLALRAG